MAEERRLVGDDGALFRGTLATTTVTTFAAGKWYKIAAKAVSNSVFGDLVVGDFYYAPIEVVGESGDEAYLLTETDLVDLSGWSLEISADEVEVTVLADKFKKYRKGKQDATGNAMFVFIKGETEQAGNLANFFFDVAVITASGVATKTARDTGNLYLIGYLDNTAVSGEAKIGTIMQVEFFNFPISVEMSTADNLEVPFRLIGDTDPILYRIVNP